MPEREEPRGRGAHTLGGAIAPQHPEPRHAHVPFALQPPQRHQQLPLQEAASARPPPRHLSPVQHRPPGRRAQPQDLHQAMAAPLLAPAPNDRHNVAHGYDSAGQDRVGRIWQPLPRSRPQIEEPRCVRTGPGRARDQQATGLRSADHEARAERGVETGGLLRCHQLLHPHILPYLDEAETRGSIREEEEAAGSARVGSSS
mmetsp:Transcript_126340/g.369139  ORF Transcript_126340/g.369139 Transcript_126340/m.369139 type:complete len:201 (-) Transcript_126340:519-1121(-)